MSYSYLNQPEYLQSLIVLNNTLFSCIKTINNVPSWTHVTLRLVVCCDAAFVTQYFTIAVSPITGHVIGNQNLTFVQSPSKSGEFRFGDKGLSKIKDVKS